MTPVTALTLLVAGDPQQKTGGYLYDAHIAQELRALGCHVAVHGLAGRFPDADAPAREALHAALAALPAEALVVIDGLALGALPDVAAAHARRLRLVALVHHPLADEWGLAAETASRLHASECAALAAMRHVIVTSTSTARHLQRDYQVPAARLSVVEPGVERAAQAPSQAPRDPGRPLQLLCIATLVPRKGHTVLVRALAQLQDLPWRCDCIGAARDPVCAAAVRTAIVRAGLQERILLQGEVSGAALECAWRRADGFVLPSWYEGYGMVIAEALCHGLPIVTTTGGALADTLPSGCGLAVAPGDAVALTAALRRLLSDAVLRARMATAARAAAQALPTWPQAGARFLAALRAVSA